MKERLVSLDAFRGITIIGMIIVTFQTIHSPEHLKGNDVQYVVKNEEDVGIIK